MEKLKDVLMVLLGVLLLVGGIALAIAIRGAILSSNLPMWLVVLLIL